MSHVATVPELLDGHAVLDMECLDRIYLSRFVDRRELQLCSLPP
jgi:hypothetical protein